MSFLSHTAPASLPVDRRSGTRVADPRSTTHSYTALARAVREEGLQGRTHGFYALLGSGLLLALAGVAAGMVLLGESWLQLLVAAGLGLVLTQIAFLAHEAAHRQVLGSGPANDRLGRVLSTLVVGISYSWWMNKHTRHHANPNRLGKDPDVDADTVVFHSEDAAGRTGVWAWFTRRQGWFFFPLLLLEGLNLHVQSVRSLARPEPVRGRWLELAMLGVRFGGYLSLVCWLLPLGMAAAFVGVQLAVFGFYLGASFAPNHVGMPVVPRDTKLDFLSKQVLTSRNVSGGWWMTLLLGGLNHQIEHHLFPSMPRPHLSRARQLVRTHCRAFDVAYTETSLPRAWAIVAAYLNRVGLAAPDVFRCPVVAELRVR